MPLPKENAFFGFGEKLDDDQRYYVDSIIDKNVVLSNSPSGSGKTTLGIAALRYLHQLGKIDHVYYLFSGVEEAAFGHTKGTLEEKEDKYTGPLDDALVAIREMPSRSRISKSLLDEQKDHKVKVQSFTWVTPMSHSFMRGINLKRSGVIIDEGQNWTRDQFKKTLSRIHEDCHLIVVGHTGQIDINPRESYLQAVIDHYAQLGEDKVRICTLSKKNYRGWISEHADLL